MPYRSRVGRVGVIGGGLGAWRRRVPWRRAVTTLSFLNEATGLEARQQSSKWMATASIWVRPS